MSLEYFEIFGYGKEYRAEGIHTTIFVYDNDELIGAIMPVWQDKLESFDGIELLKAQLEGDNDGN